MAALSTTAAVLLAGCGTTTTTTAQPMFEASWVTVAVAKSDELGSYETSCKDHGSGLELRMKATNFSGRRLWQYGPSLEGNCAFSALTWVALPLGDAAPTFEPLDSQGLPRVCKQRCAQGGACLCDDAHCTGCLEDMEKADCALAAQAGLTFPPGSSWTDFLPTPEVDNVKVSFPTVFGQTFSRALNCKKQRGKSGPCVDSLLAYTPGNDSDIMRGNTILDVLLWVGVEDASSCQNAHCTDRPPRLQLNFSSEDWSRMRGEAVCRPECMSRGICFCQNSTCAECVLDPAQAELGNGAATPRSSVPEIELRLV